MNTRFYNNKKNHLHLQAFVIDIDSHIDFTLWDWGFTNGTDALNFSVMLTCIDGNASNNATVGCVTYHCKGYMPCSQWEFYCTFQFWLPVCVNLCAVQWDFDGYIMINEGYNFQGRTEFLIWNKFTILHYTEWTATIVPYIQFL